MFPGFGRFDLTVQVSSSPCPSKATPVFPTRATRETTSLPGHGLAARESLPAALLLCLTAPCFTAALDLGNELQGYRTVGCNALCRTRRLADHSVVVFV